MDGKRLKKAEKGIASDVMIRRKVKISTRLDEFINRVWEE
jgi:hypothetical protein